MNEKEKNYKIVRSLIISSSPRDGLSLSKLLSDFREYEGTALPQFEYKHAVEFLRASGEFDIDNFGGEYIIYAKTSPKSKHISKLVAEQNKPREKRFSVQTRLSTNYGNAQQCSKPPRVHRAVPTVQFSFEQLKQEQKQKTDSESNQPIHSISERKDGDIFVVSHQEIVEEMYAVPALKTNILTPVTISHISDDGDIFCHLAQNSVDYVKKLITQFKKKASSNPFLPFDKVVSISDENLFVVQDPETNELYRAKVITETNEGSKMFFIDHGLSKLIPSSKMYQIDTGSHNEELYRYPAQAIRAKLSGVDESAVESLVQRLRRQFSLKKNAYVRKIQSNANSCEVKLYFHSLFMVCVNDSLEWENECGQITGTNDHYVHDVPDVSRAVDTADIIRNTHSIVDRTFVETSFTSIETPKIQAFVPPKLNCSFDIQIVKVESPSSFVIRPTEYIPQWQKLRKSLQTYCKEDSATLTMDEIRENEPYACLKSNGFWHRAIIKLYRSKVYSFFVDTSEIDTIDNLKRIKFLPNEYRHIPKMAMTAKLFGIEPVTGTWEMDDSVQFNRMTKGGKFQAEVKSNVISAGNSILEIVLRYENDVINDLFVESGRAIRTFC